MPVKIVPSDSSSIPESTLVLYDAMIALGGGVFRGVQQGFRDGNGKPVEPLILFDDSADSPMFTIALPASKISAHAVIAAIREKRQQIGDWLQEVSVIFQLHPINAIGAAGDRSSWRLDGR